MVPVVSGQDLQIYYLYDRGHLPALRDSDREYKLLQRALCHVPSRYADLQTRFYRVLIIQKIIHTGLDTMKVIFYGTHEDIYQATIKRLDFNVALQNMKDFMRIKKELKKRSPKLILQ